MRDYTDIIAELKDSLVENGIRSDEVENMFRKTDESEIKIITNLYDEYSTSSSVYTPEELSKLNMYKVPDDIVDFYKNYAPCDGIYFSCGIRLWSLKTIMEENSEFAPAAYLIKYGFLGFASTTGGNVFCFALNKEKNCETRIVIADHSIFCDKEIMLFNNGKLEFLELSYELINEKAPKVNDSFWGFLKRIVDNDVSDIEEYM